MFCTTRSRSVVSPGVACLGLRRPPSRRAADHSRPLHAGPGTRSVDPFVSEGWFLACSLGAAWHWQSDVEDTLVFIHSGSLVARDMRNNT